MKSLSTARPERTYKTSATTRRIRRAALLIVGATVLATLTRYPSLPEQIPVHYNLAGEVDDWGARWSVLVLAAIGAVLVIGLVWLSRYPRAFNYPRVITEENAQAVYQAGEDFMVWLAAGSSVLFAAILGIFLFSETSWVGENAVAVGIYGALGLITISIVSIVRIMRA